MEITLWLALGVNVVLLVVLAVAALTIYRSRERRGRMPLDPDLRARVLSLEKRIERLESRKY